MVFLSRPYYFKFSKGCLPQILLGPFFEYLDLHILEEEDCCRKFTYLQTLAVDANYCSYGFRVELKKQNTHYEKVNLCCNHF